MLNLNDIFKKRLLLVCLLVLPLVLKLQPGWAQDTDVVHVQIVFVDFYDQKVELEIDRKLVFSGFLVVPEYNETTGLSAIVGFNAQVGRNQYKLALAGEEISGEFEITPNTRIIYANPHFSPLLEPSNSSILLLD
jgi:hypothetical protein